MVLPARACILHTTAGTQMRKPRTRLLQIDITLNNHLAVANTALLRDYAAIDGRLRQLVLLIKHWAKQRRVNNAYTGGSCLLSRRNAYHPATLMLLGVGQLNADLFQSYCAPPVCYAGTLSSYAYCLMAIAHLQQRHPPVLPILQEGAPTKCQTIGEMRA